MWLSNNQLNLIDYYVTEEMNQHIYRKSTDLLNKEGIAFEDEDIYKIMKRHEESVAFDTIDLISDSLSKDSLIFFNSNGVSITFESKFGTYNGHSIKKDLLYNTQVALREFFFWNDYEFDKQEEKTAYEKMIIKLDSNSNLELSLNIPLEKAIILSSSDRFYDFFNGLLVFLKKWFRENENFFNDLLTLGKLALEGKTLYLNTMVDLIAEKITHTSD